MQSSVRIWSMVTMVLLALPWLSWSTAAEEKEDSAEKVAVVNGSAITRADFDQELNRAKQLYGMGRPISPSRLPEIKQKALENLIERELLYQESQKMGIIIDEATVNDQLEKLKKRFPSKDAFKKGLHRMNLWIEVDFPVLSD